MATLNTRVLQFYSGVTRFVICVGPFAIKLPRLEFGYNGWRNFLHGLLANMTETEFSSYLSGVVAPVLFSIAGGWAVIMPRAKPFEKLDNESDDDFIARFDYLYSQWLNTPNALGVSMIEKKPDSFGFINGQFLAIDYGA